MAVGRSITVKCQRDKALYAVLKAVNCIDVSGDTGIRYDVRPGAILSEEEIRGVIREGVTVNII
jgi:hypothetical protein